jgi:hypothetical protein
LVEGKNARRRIMELKQYADRQPQFTSLNLPSNNGCAKFAAYSSLDWMARSTTSSILPGTVGFGFVRSACSYSSKKNKETEFRHELAEYDANQLGFAHGRRAHASAYVFPGRRGLFGIMRRRNMTGGTIFAIAPGRAK